MEKIYNPKNIEQKIYKKWEKKGYFKPNNDTNNDSYCIMIPPPNITGSLHMGHAFQQTIMDILIRYQRMQGKNTLWQVGTDHAGIATQMVVDRKINSEEGKTRLDYDRDKFIEKIWEWQNKSKNTINNQMRRLGNSVDWERERFTMDTGISNAVKEVFIRLYNEDLIYRGKRLVNWDSKLRTAISDLEVDNRKIKSFIWHLRYPLINDITTSDGLNYIVVATTRPETILGDTGIAVHPKDKRYNNLIGNYVLVPIIGRKIKIISDEYVDMYKGTGCMKITPAHDFNDYALGKRHGLPIVNILTLDGKIKQKAEVLNTNNYYNNTTLSYIPPSFRGLERFAARDKIILEFKRLNLIQEIKKHNVIIPYGDRSGVIIEPMLTDQWYVRTTKLSKVAIEAVEKGYIKFVPKKYENIYFDWMHNIQDWCISRQLWWGHRIPAWYDKQGKVYIGRNEAEIRKINYLNSNIELYQDNDVLDTWFSSSIWTFSTLGWPKKTKDLSTFHPTNVIVSGFDIIFFWIARMIMLTMHFNKDPITGKPQVPFKTVYMTGLIRDEEGQKMSKTKGNVIDPLDMVDGISLKDLIKKRTENMMQPQFAEKIKKNTEKKFPNGIKPHGTDALRFTLAALASTGRDINWDMNRLEGYNNFCNKLWNASIFVLMNTTIEDCGFNNRKKIFSIADRWIMTELNETIKNVRNALDTYRFDQAVNILYTFTWNQFCDWYLELTKIFIKYSNENELRGTRFTLVNVLETLLRLAHPFIPFITESIWQNIKKLKFIQYNDTIMLQPFPIYDKSIVDYKALKDIELIKKIVLAVRTVRTEMNIANKKLITLIIISVSYDIINFIKDNYLILLNIARLKNIKILHKVEKMKFSITKIIDNIEILIPMEGLIDKEAEIVRLIKEIENIKNKIYNIELKLKNDMFIKRAPQNIVSKEHDKLINYNNYIKKLIEHKKIIINL